jgi:hypothetical protein
MDTALTSDMKAKHITPPEVLTTPLLTMEHRYPTTMEAQIMEHMEVQALVMEVIPAAMTPVLLIAALHLLPIHLLGMENNSSFLHHPLFLIFNFF